MKKSGSRYAANILSVIFLTGVFSSPVQAFNKCKHFKLTSYVTFLGPQGPAVGFAEATFKHGVVVPVSATAEVTSSITNDDGSIDMLVREVDEWGDLGLAIGLDKVTLVPTGTPGEFTLSIKTNIVGESGLLEDAFGLYKGTGTASFIDGTLTHSGKGTICNIKKRRVKHHSK